MIAKSKTIVTDSQAALLFPMQGRGAVTNPPGRYEPFSFVPDVDFLDHEGAPSSVPTSYFSENSKTILTTNDSPDLGFGTSINPFKGCEHGCIYCFARPSHEYLNLSPGLDFETKIFFKPKADQLLRKAFSKKGYVPKTVVLGANTDIYQPIERKVEVTRKLLEVFLEYKHPVALITKSALILRDIDILEKLAKLGLLSVAISITTLDPMLANVMEPRAATPERRLENIRQLSAKGIPCVVLSSPMIPGLNDAEMENILTEAAAAGAQWAAYTLLRLPHQNKEIFESWLQQFFPDRKKKVLKLIRETRQGRLYQSDFGTRMRGTGTYAELLESRFVLQCKRLNFSARSFDLRTDLFTNHLPVQLPLLDTT